MRERWVKSDGSVNRCGPEESYSDDDLWRVLGDLPAMQVFLLTSTEFQ